MQLSSKKLRPSRGAFALIITLIFLGVVLMIFASIFYWAGTGAKTTLRNNQYNMSQAAAEAATEDVLGYMLRDFTSQTIGSSSYYASLPTNVDQSTWPVQYQFSDTNGVANQISVTIGPVSSSLIALNSQYGGLSGYAQNVLLVARATPVSQPQNVTATVDEALQLAYIPLFQFAIFYNVNMEIAPGGGMQVTGPVYCDQSIWEATGTFSTNVTAVGTNCLSDNDPFANSYSKSHSATFQMAGQPLNSGNSLTMPIGTNNDPATVIALLQWPPTNYALATAAAYTTNGLAYPANECDLIISNAANGTNWGSLTPMGTNLTLYYQDSANTPYLTQITPDYYILQITNANGSVTTLSTNYVIPTTNVYYAGFSFVSNTAFWDYRESKKVQAVEIDVSKFNIWVTNTATNQDGNYIAGGGYNQECIFHKGITHPIDGIYVYNSVPITGQTVPSVRMVNGQALASSAGLTIATPFPMYVKGDYNVRTNVTTGGCDVGLNSTAHTYPAALMADSITILSSNWSDSYNTSTSLTARNPVETTINAGMLEGIVPSNTNISGSYSGGVENFMRLEENWGAPLYYNGAIVVLFYSHYATGAWQAPGAYYQVPTREWAFDNNFKQQAKLPPMTPEVKAVVRGQWTATDQ